MRADGDSRKRILLLCMIIVGTLSTAVLSTFDGRSDHGSGAPFPRRRRRPRLVASRTMEDALGPPRDSDRPGRPQRPGGRVARSHQLGGVLPTGSSQTWGRRIRASRQVVVFAIERPEGTTRRRSSCGQVRVRRDEGGVLFAVPSRRPGGRRHVRCPRPRVRGPRRHRRRVRPSVFLQSLHLPAGRPRAPSVAPIGALRPSFTPSPRRRTSIPSGTTSEPLALQQWSERGRTLDGQASVTGRHGRSGRAAQTWNDEPIRRSTAGQRREPSTSTPSLLLRLVCMSGGGVIGCGGPSRRDSSWRGGPTRRSRAEVWLRSYCTLDLWDHDAVRLTHSSATLGLGHPTRASHRTTCSGDENPRRCAPSSRTG